MKGQYGNRLADPPLNHRLRFNAIHRGLPLRPGEADGFQFRNVARNPLQERKKNSESSNVEVEKKKRGGYVRRAGQTPLSRNRRLALTLKMGMVRRESSAACCKHVSDMVRHRKIYVRT